MNKWFKQNSVLIFILGAGFLLFVFGINWGLPAQWHVDEKLKVDIVLHMAASGNLNPHNFVNPSLHLYLLNLVLMPYLVFIRLIHPVPLNTSLVYIISRLFSVAMGILTVLLVYLIGRKVFDRRTGIFAALVLTLTMGFVNIVHFAIPEATVTFLATLTLLFCVYILETADARYYLLAGASAGLAVSTKYTAWLLILPISVAFFLNEGKKIYKEKFNHLNAAAVSAIMLFVGILIVVISFFDYRTFLIHRFSPDGIIDPGTAQFLGFLQKWGKFFGCLIILSAILVKYFIPIRNLLTNIFANKKILLAVLSIVVFFLIGTPYSLLDLRSFLNSIIDDWQFASGHKDFSSPYPVWSLYISSLRNIFGTPLLWLCLFGLGYGFFKACNGNRYILIFLSWVIPFYVFLSQTHHFAMRFVIPIVPILSVFAAVFISGLMDLRGFPKRVVNVLIFLILAYSLIYTATVDWMFLRDSRYQANAWIDSNIAKNSVIDTFSSVEGFLPTIPGGYNIRHFPEIEDRTLDKTGFKRFIQEYQDRSGEYIILTSHSYARYLERPDVYPEQTKFYTELIQGKSGYRLAAKFDFRGFLNPEPEAVDPEISILVKGHPSEN